MIRSLRIQILALTAMRVVLNTMHRMVYPFLPVFSRALGVSLPALSIALTLRSLLGAIGPFLASISDSRGRKLVMALGLLFFTAGVGLVALRPVYLTFVLALLLAVLGKLIFDPSMQAYLGDRVPYERRGRALAVTELSWSVSFILGMPVVGLLLSRGGWVAPFPVLAFLGLCSIAGLAWLLPGDRPDDQNLPGFRSNLRTVFTSERALIALSLGVLVTSANEVVNLVFGVWMDDSFGLKIAALGAASVVIGVAELGGEALVGGLVDRLGKARAIGIGLILNSLAAMALPVLGTSVPGALVGLFLFFITYEFTLVSLIPMMTEILPEARATLMAANAAGLSLGHAAGALFATPLYGLGILASGGAAAVLNLLALVALQLLRKKMGDRQV
ncbi:MAG: MFS transporter [Chloroflexota bacterium]|nr:MAG: MFS transporter [Chloroflexota bacterium]